MGKMILGTVISVIFLAGLGSSDKFPVKLNDNQLAFLATALPMEYASVAPHTLSLLEPLLIPRPMGSAGHRKAFEYIVSHFQNLDWNVEVDAFSAMTPKGEYNFSNIIASSNPFAKKKLVLAAHYDSKTIEGIEFIGATDSAVPCAILMNVAQRLSPYLMQASDENISIDLIFFDGISYRLILGEEAFVEWTSTDSIYGSKHLAERWATQMTQIKERNFGQESTSTFKPVLSMIELFILLDLLGTSDSQIPNYFEADAASNEAYLRLVDIQGRLQGKRLFSIPLSERIKRDGGLFKAEKIRSAQVEDDHIPFLQRNVPVLHVIPSPFPSVWHNANDNQAALDQGIIRDWCLVWAVFVSEYIGIDFNLNPV